eukprot:Skav219044  [mRNA]  locus=scaffold2272:58140:62869:+ [translate_table: standard]
MVAEGRAVEDAFEDRSKLWVCPDAPGENKEIPRPWGVHEYLTKNLGRNEHGVGAANGALMTEDSVKDTATWWRDVEVKRKLVDDPAIYEEILQKTEWRPSNLVESLREKYQGIYLHWSTQDQVLQKLFAEYGIADRTSGIITNWYPDGQGTLGSHRHDCWTALFSFGHERILTIDNTPLLMQDGDLCIFGTQRHGVPLMPEITEGRITLVVFFYPNDMQKKGRAPPPIATETRDAGATVGEGPAAGRRQGELIALQNLGFAHADALVALRSTQGDADAAAELLLLSGAGADLAEAARAWRCVALRCAGGGW